MWNTLNDAPRVHYNVTAFVWGDDPTLPVAIDRTLSLPPSSLPPHHPSVPIPEGTHRKRTFRHFVILRLTNNFTIINNINLKYIRHSCNDIMTITYFSRLCYIRIRDT